ncbi:MAG: hypothetical protein H8E73_05530, partial [Planctomycetes bacterium]|nr:hypothetical protein [Planctomycetota bacterium]
MCELPTWVEGSDGQLNCMRRTTGGLEQDQAHLRGQSRLLHETLSSSGILASAFDDPYWTGLALHDLAWVLSDRDRTIRNQAAAYVMEGLWHHQKRIGIRKLIRRVAESQFRQVSWDGYRDHISHTVIVFLNGLYIYSTLPAVQIAFSNTLGWDESAFLQHWSLTATAHDIGYIFELTDENDRASSFSFVTDLSNNFLSYIEEELEPILVQDGHQARSLRDDENRRSQILSVLGLNQRKIQDVEDLETVWGSNLSLLAFLDERCADTKLHPEHPISNYYNQCLRTSPSLKGNRPPFRDHGVCGALLLLHFAHLQKTFFECLDRVLCDTTSQGFEDLRAIGRVEVLQSLCQWAGSQEGIVDSASEAAVAIALHNVQNVWNSSPATARLDLSAYSIHLDKYPLAFLLYVSDVLQDWDRAVYSPSGEVEREWRDAWDVRFATASEDRENTHLFIWAGRRTRIDNIRQNLKDVLPEPDRNRLLREGPPPTEQHHSEDEHTLETSDGLQTLSPIDDYIEREQLFASYSDFLASDDTWVFSVVGDPGTGKSRFLDRRYGEAQEDGTITVRIDFCRGYESPDLFAEELISQLPLNSNIERR